jgi:hypothetical protein
MPKEPVIVADDVACKSEESGLDAKGKALFGVSGPGAYTIPNSRG